MRDQFLATLAAVFLMWLLSYAIRSTAFAFARRKFKADAKSAIDDLRKAMQPPPADALPVPRLSLKTRSAYDLHVQRAFESQLTAFLGSVQPAANERDIMVARLRLEAEVSDTAAAMAEGAFVDGWRSCEICTRQPAAPDDEHILHHFAAESRNRILADLCELREQEASAPLHPHRICVACKGREFQICSDGPFEAFIRCMTCGERQPEEMSAATTARSE
jgi:hypothetical protein